jgi:hypothetical protein
METAVGILLAVQFVVVVIFPGVAAAFAFGS